MLIAFGFGENYVRILCELDLIDMRKMNRTVMKVYTTFIIQMIVNSFKHLRSDVHNKMKLTVPSI